MAETNPTFEEAGFSLESFQSEFAEDNQRTDAALQEGNTVRLTYLEDPGIIGDAMNVTFTKEEIA